MKAIPLFLLFTIAVPFYADNTSLIGKSAPPINARAIAHNEIITISPENFQGHYTILIFYPADFSFICPTELRAFQEKKEEFSARNTSLFGISIDQVYSHKAWLNTSKEKQGVKGITYPLISDVTKEISRSYGVLDESGVAQRALFIIDPENIVQAIMITHENIGRNVDEALRLLDAAQAAAQSEGQMCPANWHEGDATISTNNTTNQFKKEKQHAKHTKK